MPDVRPAGAHSPHRQQHGAAARLEEEGGPQALRPRAGRAALAHQALRALEGPQVREGPRQAVLQGLQGLGRDMSREQWQAGYWLARRGNDLQVLCASRPCAALQSHARSLSRSGTVHSSPSSRQQSFAPGHQQVLQSLCRHGQSRDALRCSYLSAHSTGGAAALLERRKASQHIASRLSAGLCRSSCLLAGQPAVCTCSKQPRLHDGRQPPPVTLGCCRHVPLRRGAGLLPAAPDAQVQGRRGDQEPRRRRPGHLRHRHRRGWHV